MKLLPFMDISVVEDDTPSAIERLEGLVEWADGEKIKLSAAFLAYEQNGEDIENYLFQIGYIKDGGLVTSKDAITEAGNHCEEYKQWKENARHLFEIRAHLELYYAKIELVPPWGSRKYYNLVEKGITPRILHGPHKRGRLKPNQKRYVVLDENREIQFGPLL